MPPPPGASARGNGPGEWAGVSGALPEGVRPVSLVDAAEPPMNKTITLFSLAFLALLGALVVGPRPPRPDRVAHPIVRLTEPVRLEARAQPVFVPQGPDQRVAVSIEVALDRRRALALVVDRSGSMAERSGVPIRAAQDAVFEAVSGLGPGDVVALLSCASDVTVDLPLGPPPPGGNRLRWAVADLLPGGGTQLAVGLERALDVLRDRPEGTRPEVVLVTDGRPMSRGNPHPGLTAAFRRAAREGVEVEVHEVAPTSAERRTRADRRRRELVRAGNRARTELAASVCVELASGVRLGSERPGGFRPDPDLGCDVLWRIPEGPGTVRGSLQLRVDARRPVERVARISVQDRGAGRSAPVDLGVRTRAAPSSVLGRLFETISPEAR